jgi:hypothetical protein
MSSMSNVPILLLGELGEEERKVGPALLDEATRDVERMVCVAGASDDVDVGRGCPLDGVTSMAADGVAACAPPSGSESLLVVPTVPLVTPSPAACCAFPLALTDPFADEALWLAVSAGRAVDASEERREGCVGD